MGREDELQGSQSAMERLIGRAEAFDAKFKIGMGCFSVRIGYSQLIGAIPVLGDLGVLALSIYMASSCWKCCRTHTQGKIPWSLKMKIIGNVLSDVIIGFVPIGGDVCNIVFKFNRRNVALVKRHLNLHVNNGERQLYLKRAMEGSAIEMHMMRGEIDETWRKHKLLDDVPS